MKFRTELLPVLTLIALAACHDRSAHYQALPVAGASHATTVQPTGPASWERHERDEDAGEEKREAEDNPDGLDKAMQALKTNVQGETYVVGYQLRALTEARKRRKQPGTLLPWLERGPGNISGRVQQVMVDGDDPSHNTWLTASVGGGIWRTQDAGEHWQHLSEGLENLVFSSLAQCASQPQVIYAGTGMPHRVTPTLVGNGIWKSTNGGNTWTLLASTIDGQMQEIIGRIVVDPANPDLVLACASNRYLSTRGSTHGSSIYRSVDGGTTWTKVFDADTVFGPDTYNSIEQIIAKPDDFSVLFACVNRIGVLKSSDAGLTWALVDYNFREDGGEIPDVSRMRIELAIAASQPNTMYASVERENSTPDLIVSRDAGASWTKLEDTGGDPDWLVSGWFNNTLVVHPYDENIVFLGGKRLWRAEIYGASRTTTQIISRVHSDHHSLLAIADDPASGQFRILDGSDGGLAVSLDQGETFYQTVGMRTTQFYGVDKKPGEDVYIGGMQDNNTYHSPLDPALDSEWVNDTSGDGFELAWHSQNSNLIISSSQFGHLYRSEDGGQSWRTILNNEGPFLSRIAHVKTDPDVVYTLSGLNVYRSDDFGSHWNSLGISPISPSSSFSDIDVCPADPRGIYACSAYINHGVHVSDDGASFRNITANFPASVAYTSGVVAHPLDPDKAYFLFGAPGSPKILYTSDRGRSFTDISGFEGNGGVSANGFPDVAVFTLVVMPHDPNILWAGTEIGLVESRDGGQHWELADNGLPAVAVFQLRVIDDQVVAATHGRGVWSVRVPGLDQGPQLNPVLSPLLSALYRDPAGNLVAKARLRSSYDGSALYLDNQLVVTVPANSDALELCLQFPMMDDQIHKLQSAPKGSSSTLPSPCPIQPCWPSRATIMKPSLTLMITAIFSNPILTSKRKSDSQALRRTRLIPSWRTPAIPLS